MIDELRSTKEGLTGASLSSCPIPKTNIPSKNCIFTKRYFSMQNLPIGEQNFAKIRELDMLYVDKTEQICQLLKGGSYNFISRPRRFGKSLTLSTIQCIFEGKRSFSRTYGSKTTGIGRKSIQ
jgi:Predicted AAA-ATPase